MMIRAKEKQAGRKGHPSDQPIGNIYAHTRHRVAIAGAGWFGASLAVYLNSLGHLVTVFEKKEQIFAGISGKFGIRVHAGPHYPRSAETRKHCRNDARRFQDQYPSLINRHAYSFYGLGKIDALGNPPKVDVETFRKVCQEVPGATEIDTEKSGYRGLLMGANIPENSCAVGRKLRGYFESNLAKNNVEIRYHTEITSVKRTDNGKGVFVSSTDHPPELFDFVINTTGFHSLRPNEPLPFGIKCYYQPCLALVYEDLRKESHDKSALPFSAIVMDGWFPCIMPYDNDDSKTAPPSKRYIVTHGSWTIMGSHTELSEAKKQLADVSDTFVDAEIRPHCERDLRRFWPEFNSRNFKYLEWTGAVVPKIRSDVEYRSALTFQHVPTGIINVFPGKISNVMSVRDEVRILIQEQERTVSVGNYRYTKGGALDTGHQEIHQKGTLPNTGDLQTYNDVVSLRQTQRRYEWVKIYLITRLTLALTSLIALLACPTKEVFLVAASVGILLILSTKSNCTKRTMQTDLPSVYTRSPHHENSGQNNCCKLGMNCGL